MSPDNEYNSRDGDSPRGGRGDNDSAVSPTPRLPGPPPNNDVDSDALEKLRQQVCKVPRHPQSSAATLLQIFTIPICFQEREEREEIEKELRAQQEQQAAALTAAAAQMFGGRAAVGAPGSADTNGRSGH